MSWAKWNSTANTRQYWGIKTSNPENQPSEEDLHRERDLEIQQTNTHTHARTHTHTRTHTQEAEEKYMFVCEIECVCVCVLYVSSISRNSPYRATRHSCTWKTPGTRSEERRV